MKAEDRHLTSYNKGALDALINTYLFDTEYYHSEGDKEGARSLSKTKEEIMASLQKLLQEDLRSLYEKYAGQNREMEDEINWRKKNGKNKDRNKEKVQKALAEIVAAMQMILAQGTEIIVTESAAHNNKPIEEIIPTPVASPLQTNSGSKWPAILEEEWQPELLEEEDWEGEPIITLPDTPIITQGKIDDEEVIVVPLPRQKVPETPATTFKPLASKMEKSISSTRKKSTPAPRQSRASVNIGQKPVASKTSAPKPAAPKTSAPKPAIAKASAPKPAKALASKPAKASASKPAKASASKPAKTLAPKLTKASAPKPAKVLATKPAKVLATKPVASGKSSQKKASALIDKVSPSTKKKGKKGKKSGKTPGAQPEALPLQPELPVDAQQERIHTLIKDYLGNRPSVDHKERERYEEKMRLERYEKEREKRLRKEQRSRSKARKTSKSKPRSGQSGSEKKRVDIAPAKKKKPWWSIK